MGRRGRASACPRSRTGQVIWLAAALLLLAVAVLALWLYETHGAPDGQSAETRQVPPIPPAGGEGPSCVEISIFLQGIELWNSFCKN